MFPDGDCTMACFDRRVVRGEIEEGLPGESGKCAELGEAVWAGEMRGVGEVGESGEFGESGVRLSTSKRSLKSMSSDRRVMWRGGAGVEISSTGEVSAVLAGGWEMMGLSLDLVWPMVDAKPLLLAQDEMLFKY